MENALLIGLSRQMALRRELDLTANNLANLNTTGFKAEGMLLEQVSMPRARDGAFRGSDRVMAYVQDWGSVRDLDQGMLKRTGGDLDVAISGEGYLAVETPDGERYTRNGQLTRNDQGEIVTSDGFRVLGEAGPIRLQENDISVTIAGDGTVSTPGGQRGRIRVVGFDNPQAMELAGGSLFSSRQAPQPAPNARLVQGALESSNVKSIGEMTRMVEVTRAYQSLASTMQRTDELRRQAIGELARTP